MKSLNQAIVAGLLVLGSVSAFAQMGMGKTFEERKAHVLEEVTARETAVATLKTCVTNAKDDAGLKACHEQIKEAKKDMRMEHMEAKKSRMEKRMEKMKSESK